MELRDLDGNESALVTALIAEEVERIEAARRGFQMGPEKVEGKKKSTVPEKLAALTKEHHGKLRRKN